MSPYVLALLIGAIIAAGLNFNQPRALIWIAVGATDFALTYRYGVLALRYPDGFVFAWLPHAFVTGVTDAIVVIALATFGVTRWERLVRYAFIVSIAISVAHLLGSIDRTSHAEWLEIANWFALLFIGGAGLLRLLDDLVGSRTRSSVGGGLHMVSRFLDKEKRPQGVIAQALGQG